MTEPPPRPGGPDPSSSPPLDDEKESEAPRPGSSSSSTAGRRCRPEDEEHEGATATTASDPANQPHPSEDSGGGLGGGDQQTAGTMVVDAQKKGDDHGSSQGGGGSPSSSSTTSSSSPSLVDPTTSSSSFVRAHHHQVPHAHPTTNHHNNHLLLHNPQQQQQQQQEQPSQKVRVGVRVRPLTNRELGEGGTDAFLKINSVSHQVSLGNRRTFTFDEVFDPSTSQQELYDRIQSGLLGPFWDGYNATILAYGQTGSGKTFTMGSESAQLGGGGGGGSGTGPHDSVPSSSSMDADGAGAALASTSLGLIPRFMADLFAAIQKESSANNSNCHCSVHASFLEVYGEDVHDLLHPDRPSLPIREDEDGQVNCPGLTTKSITTPEQAMHVLQVGTWNRTTAATWMNLTSSRSHAVFSVHLSRTITTGASTTTTTSRFTFVDLAGSERLKKTGAEGERAKEGIKINQGLLALGNVINALAFQKPHVPYRQSKLTRLLQDALGGNSRTLFLACVSPSDTNAGETLSTLHYANRARDIQNVATRNLDPHQLQLQKLQNVVRVLESELVRTKFPHVNMDIPGGEVSLPPDVAAYLADLYARAGNAPMVNHSLLPSSATSTAFPHSSDAMYDRGPAIASATTAVAHFLSSSHTAADSSVTEGGNHGPDLLTSLNPDEEMAILDQLLELQQKDQEFDDNQREEMKKVEGELAEQQELLQKLRSSLQTYHELKAQYELVMVEMQQLEREKADLKAQLETASADPSVCSKSIQRNLERVEQALARARNESRRHRELYRKAEVEAKKCGALERQISALKQSRAKLQKQQQQSAATHRAHMETKTRELLQLKRRERKNEHAVSQLQKEVAIQKRHLDQRHEYIGKLNGKLKQTERHLLKLLSLRRGNSIQLARNGGGLSRRPSKTVGGARGAAAAPADPVESEKAPSPQEVESLHYLVEEWVAGKVEQAQLHLRYQELVANYGAAMRELVAAVKAVEEHKETRGDVGPAPMEVDDAAADEKAEVDSSGLERERNLEDLELKVELLGQELEALRDQLGSDDVDSPTSGDDDVDLDDLLGDKERLVLQRVLRGTLESLVSARVQNHVVDRTRTRVESIRQGLEDEIDALNARLASVTQELSLHQQQSGPTSPSSLQKVVARLETEKSALEESRARTTEALQVARRECESTLKRQRLLESDLAEAQETLALHLAAGRLESQALNASEAVVVKIQEVWNELGISPGPRAEIRRDIENSLEDTCERKLREAIDLRDKILRDIAAVHAELTAIQMQLGSPSASIDTTQPLLRQLELLQAERDKVEPIYVAAKERAAAIAQQSKDIASTIGLTDHDLHEDLQVLALAELPSRSLSAEFLRRCEKHLSVLRLQKTNLLAQNSVRMKETHALVVEMNLRIDQILPLVVQSMKKRQVPAPHWWNEATATSVANGVSIPGGVARVARDFSQHLGLVSEALESVSRGRRCLSDLLRQLIERAQKTLLATVEGDEVDAGEAYTTFREALFRLPALSKERIHACVSEIDSLMAGVEAMAQSEIEALSVVWEASEISMSERGRFWGEIEDTMKATEANPVGPFDAVLQICLDDSEEWVLSAVRDATKPYRLLESRVFKLERVHAEVEHMRSRQDAKSKIISLDSEVRMLSAKLAEFEDTKCSKQRLLTKKSNSSHLLKEERFRKQMQQKYSSKLEQLGKLLQAWRDEQRIEFDSSLLSEEVRTLLKNPQDMSALVEKRTEFMHLRTIKSAKRSAAAVAGSHSRNVQPPLPPSTRKRLGAPATAASAAGPSEVEKMHYLTTGAPPPTSGKRAASETFHQSKKLKTDRSASSPSRAGQVRLPSATNQRSRPVPVSATVKPKHLPLGTSASNAPASPCAPPPPVAGTGKRLTLPPFGHVLDQVETPRHGGDGRENAFLDRPSPEA